MATLRRLFQGQRDGSAVRTGV
jgi:hypothetical protein